MLVKLVGLVLGFVAMIPTVSLAQELCTPGTLKGHYIFAGRGFIEPADPGVQRLHYGAFVFDAVDKFSGKQSSSRGGKIGRETVAGTYTLDADCTGTMTFGSYLKPGAQIHWDIYVAKDGAKGHMIRMDAGTMAVRSFER